MADRPVATARPAAQASKRVLVTRPGEQAEVWVGALNSRGIDAVAVPLIGIAEAPDPAAVDEVWNAIEACDLLVFVSPNAVTQFFARQPTGKAWPDELLVAAPGPGTGGLLRARGIAEARLIEPAGDAENFDSESLWERLGALPWRGKRVLIVRGDGGRDWLASRLREAGAEVRYLAAYRRSPPVFSQAALCLISQALAEPDGHLWFFSSSEAVVHLLQSELLQQPGMRAALASAMALATHPRIAGTARDAGFKTVLQCRPGLDDVVACIQSNASLELSSASRIPL